MFILCIIRSGQPEGECAVYGKEAKIAVAAERSGPRGGAVALSASH